jgi:hypothetical protein
MCIVFSGCAQFEIPMLFDLVTYQATLASCSFFSLLLLQLLLILFMIPLCYSMCTVELSINVSAMTSPCRRGSTPVGVDYILLVYLTGSINQCISSYSK